MDAMQRSSVPRRCWGLTATLHRCGRVGEWQFFCHEHSRQPLLWVFTAIFTVGAGLATYYGVYLVFHPPPLEQTRGPKGEVVQKATLTGFEREAQDAAVRYQQSLALLPTM